MTKKSTRVLIAKETLQIIENGSYWSRSNVRVDISEWMQFAQSYSIHYSPEIFEDVFRERDEILREQASIRQTRFEVRNETTLHAARRLLVEGAENVLCLNFASAKNPRGGFLNGSQAQEESLARATGIYPCIAQMREMYDANRDINTCLYTDHMIYSPDVPVFRDDDDELLDTPYQASFITAPAVNIGGMANRGEVQSKDKIALTMLSRIEKILSIAVVHGHSTLVLGAWGCGVFRNRPDEVAGYFYTHLMENPIFEGAFEKVVFAVLDQTDDKSTITPFQELFLGITEGRKA